MLVKQPNRKKEHIYMMSSLFGFLIFIGIFLVFDAVRKLNNNIITQTEEIKKLHERLK
ncbi:hypothetical protein [Gottfriedia solisilvae]|nr:hypothetical protein [Gottfriedia solisilvae]